MSKVLPQAENVFAYVKDGVVIVAAHGERYEDDRRIALSPDLALRLAEVLIRAVRNPNPEPGL